MGYVHGFSGQESDRLVDQAQTLADLLHDGTTYAPGHLVLEAGCGTGAQTAILAHRHPGAHFVSVDKSADSLAQARERLAGLGGGSVALQRADITDLPYVDACFDDVFVCFVLEHLPDPGCALAELRRVLRPGGSITAIEGDHRSAYFHPDSMPAQRAIECLVELQRRDGGDPHVGRRLYPLLAGAGFRSVRVSPRIVYVDDTRPSLADGFTRKTFTAMVEGVGDRAIAEGLTDRESWAAGVRALQRTAEPGGTFCYTFFRAVGRK